MTDLHSNLVKIRFFTYQFQNSKRDDRYDSNRPNSQRFQLPKGKLINPLSMNPVSALLELVPGVTFNTMSFGSRSMWFVTESVVQARF